MAQASGEARQMKSDLDRLADLLAFPEEFGRDPHQALKRQGLQSIPDEVVDALAELSPEELRLFARVHHKLSKVPPKDEMGIIF
jgi:hypothetical protein